jgi:hypothetical protein
MDPINAGINIGYYHASPINSKCLMHQIGPNFGYAPFGGGLEGWKVIIHPPSSIFHLPSSIFYLYLLIQPDNLDIGSGGQGQNHIQGTSGGYGINNPQGADIAGGSYWPLNSGAGSSRWTAQELQ